MDSMGTSRIETAIQRISESVFVGLCNIAGTSQMVAMRRDMMEINDILNCKPTDSRGYTLMLSGSKKEGFRLKGSDIDIMMWPNNHRVISKLSQFQYYNINRQTLILSDCSNSPPGFTLLYLINPSTHGLIRKACVKMNERQCVSSSKYRQVWCSISPGFTQHGPCIYQEDSDFDQAISLYSDFWPPSASSWIDRCHSWPQPHVVDDIVKNGCHFVAIGHKLGRHENHEWRISFSLAEQKLVYAMNHSQALTFILLKLFIKEIINNEIADDDKLLCSYHMKTAVFWVIQQNIIPHCCPQNLLEGFWVCFKLLLKWVYEGVCPNFFIPENNMFLTKIYGEAQNQLFMRLFGLYEKGLASLLHSPSISPFIINVLFNPRLSICTNEHTLISETMFDLKVFEELYAKNTPFIQNLQRSFMYLHKIEYMINLPLLTQS
ncbi:uncharacterized protein LOC134278136 [Saccostrea cucullata]|uniref:uncharacterized protein LOC134278136 n=1 Tax=Saccostrea cuccullata TaxID=36930 RepID=UPI002ED47D50